MNRYNGAVGAAITARDENRGIRIISKPQVVGAVANVTCGEQPVMAELFLHRQVPLLYIGGSEIQGQIDEDPAGSEKCICGRGGERERESGDFLSLVRICQSAHWPVDDRSTAEGTIIGKAIKVELFGIIVKQAITGANGLTPFATRVPVEAGAWRKIGNVPVHIGAGGLCVTTEEQPRRRVGENGAGGAGGKCGGIKMAATMIAILRGEVRLPAHPSVQREVMPDTIVILEIEPVVILPPVLLLGVSLSQTLDVTQEKIYERISAASSTPGSKGKLPVALERRQLVQLSVDPICAEGELMFSPDPIEIVRHLKRVGVEMARGGASAFHIEVIAYAHDQRARDRAGDVDSQRSRIGHSIGRSPEDCHPGPRRVDRINH